MMNNYLLLICVLLLASGVSPAAKPAISPALEATIQATISALGHESWSERQAAEDKLREIGMAHHEPVLDRALSAFVEAEDPEVRHRLRSVIRELVIEFHFQEEHGYLGILVKPVRFAERVDDQLIYPLRVQYLFPEAQADVGDLSIGDILIQVDDYPFDRDFGHHDLLHYIQMQKPGDSVTFVTLENGRQIRKVVTLGKRPASPDDLPPEERQSEFFRKWFRGQVELVRRSRPAAQPAEPPD